MYFIHILPTLSLNYHPHNHCINHYFISIRRRRRCFSPSFFFFSLVGNRFFLLQNIERWRILFLKIESLAFYFFYFTFEALIHLYILTKIIFLDEVSEKMPIWGEFGPFLWGFGPYSTPPVAIYGCFCS